MSRLVKARNDQVIKWCRDVPHSLDSLIACCCMNWGVTRRTAREYLRVLFDFGAISWDGETIKVKASYRSD